MWVWDSDKCVIKKITWQENIYLSFKKVFQKPTIFLFPVQELKSRNCATGVQEQKGKFYWNVTSTHYYVMRLYMVILVKMAIKWQQDHKMWKISKHSKSVAVYRDSLLLCRNTTGIRAVSNLSTVPRYKKIVAKKLQSSLCLKTRLWLFANLANLRDCSHSGHDHLEPGCLPTGDSCNQTAIEGVGHRSYQIIRCSHQATVSKL